MIRLAIRNMLHDRLRFLLTVAGIAFAFFLMGFQGSLLCGFEVAASKVIDSIDADLWVMHRGVQAFDFAPPLPSDYFGVVNGVPGVEYAGKMAAGLAFWKRPGGTQKTVVLIGAGPGISGTLPFAAGRVWLPEDVVADTSDLGALGVARPPADVEINRRRRRLEQTVSGFGSFIGSPYVFGSLKDTLASLGLDGDAAMFLLLRVRGRSIHETQAALSQRLPELDVLSKAEFSRRARLYWTLETGAGGALFTAALLGFVVGVLIVSQTVYATTMENIEEFATLKALGASAWMVTKIVTVQAFVSTLLGWSLGIASLAPVCSVARRVIPWLYTPWELPVGLLSTTIVLAALASLAASKAALTVEPGRVFRA